MNSGTLAIGGGEDRMQSNMKKRSKFDILFKVELGLIVGFFGMADHFSLSQQNELSYSALLLNAKK